MEPRGREAADCGRQEAGEPQGGPSPVEELRGVWISYLDWEKLPAEEQGFKAGVDAILDRCVELRMNAVFVQVRPDADAMYPSSYFPWSRFITGIQGQDPGYNPPGIFCAGRPQKGAAVSCMDQPIPGDRVPEPMEPGVRAKLCAAVAVRRGYIE